MKKTRLSVIAGPTASGKTQTAIETALELNAEIVSADSMLIYKRMDIGTAKPNKEQLKTVRHHMIDIVEPWQEYSVSDYEKDARRAVSDILSSNKTPILCGGTGFYINAVINGTFKTPRADKKIREEIERRLNSGTSLKELHDELKRIDPQTASWVHENDNYRITRALEVYYSTGKTMSHFRDLHEKERNADIDPMIIVIDVPKDELQRRIEQRTDKMLEQGLLEEVEGLIKAGCTEDLKPMKSIGYLQAVKVLKGEMNKDQAIEEINAETLALAKRQLTWFKKRDGIKWMPPAKISSITDEIRRFLDL